MLKKKRNMFYMVFVQRSKKIIEIGKENKPKIVQEAHCPTPRNHSSFSGLKGLQSCNSETATHSIHALAWRLMPAPLQTHCFPRPSTCNY